MEILTFKYHKLNLMRYFVKLLGDEMKTPVCRFCLLYRDITFSEPVFVMKIVFWHYYIFLCRWTVLCLQMNIYISCDIRNKCLNYPNRLLGGEAMILPDT